MKRIYLDYNSTAPLDPRLLKILAEEFEEEVGNPSSIHFHGQLCRKKLEKSREIIARFFRVSPSEVIFTSGGTESAAMLLRGVLNLNSQGHVITSNVEHACVYETLKVLQKKGIEVTFLPTGEWGAIRAEDVERAILPHTRLITLMAANNETGVKTDIEAIAKISERANIPFVVDGVSWLGKEKIHLSDGISAIFFSGHKIYAPKGVGFCICRKNFKFEPLLVGGGQEHNRRSGTENLPGIVAMSHAIAFLEQDQDALITETRRLRDFFEKSLISRLGQVVENGEGPRISNTSNLAFLGIDGETLLINLDREGISVSHGSACSSGALELSRVLLAMDIPRERVRSSLRFSLGRMTTEEEIQRAIEIIVRTVERMRGIST